MLGAEPIFGVSINNVTGITGKAYTLHDLVHAGAEAEAEAVTTTRRRERGRRRRHAFVLLLLLAPVCTVKPIGSVASRSI